MFGFSSIRCFDCENLDTSDRNKYNEAYCPVEREYVSLDSHTCRYFKPNFYVMTVYSILNNIPFDGEFMSLMLNFRDDYMLTNEDGIKFLNEYEYYGPYIANKLIKDMYRSDIICEMEEDYVNPMISFINEKRYMDAQNTYISMIEKLKIRYGLSEMKEKTKDFKF